MLLMRDLAQPIEGERNSRMETPRLEVRLFSMK
jgi:hypothetical protein